MLVGYSDYPTHGPTHRPLNPERLVTVFKNIRSYFPNNSLEAEKAMLDSYLIKFNFQGIQQSDYGYSGFLN